METLNLQPKDSSSRVDTAVNENENVLATTAEMPGVNKQDIKVNVSEFQRNNIDNNNDNIATLRVAETLPKFVGRGIGLIDPKAMEDLNLSPGDVVEIASRRKSSYVLLWSGQPDDDRKGLKDSCILGIIWELESTIR